MAPSARLIIGTASQAQDGQRFALLTTAGFVAELHDRLAKAQRSVSIQLMTFDGDQSGLAVAAQLMAAARRGVRVRLLVDCFARRFVSDQPVRRPEVIDEHRRTQAMFDELANAGVALRFTNPNGPLNLFSLARNHKKLYVIDDLVYLGGVNVSDHNFSWHDFMVRIDDRALHRAVVDDFENSFAGRRRRVDGPIVTNQAVERTFDQLVAGARHRLVIASPYAVDRRLVALLERCPAPAKSLILVEHNNFRFLQLITPYLSERLTRAGVGLFNYDRFSHAKFLLVDDDALLIGSSNFGRHSCWCNQEIGLVIRDREFISCFQQSLLSGLRPAAPTQPERRLRLGRLASAAMDRYLMLYARVIVPCVPSLARSARTDR